MSEINSQKDPESVIQGVLHTLYACCLWSSITFLPTNLKTFRESIDQFRDIVADISEPPSEYVITTTKSIINLISKNGEENTLPSEVGSLSDVVDVIYHGINFLEEKMRYAADKTDPEA